MTQASCDAQLPSYDGSNVAVTNDRQLDISGRECHNSTHIALVVAHSRAPLNFTHLKVRHDTPIAVPPCVREPRAAVSNSRQ